MTEIVFEGYICGAGYLEHEEEVEQGLTGQLLLPKEEEEDDQAENGSSLLRPASSVASAYRLLTPSVKVRVRAAAWHITIYYTWCNGSPASLST
jgi:hypothetical protein